MYRVLRHGVAAASAAAVLATQRVYTPVYQPEPVEDRIGSLRRAAELNTLWSRSVPVPDLPRAVQLWLRYGNDPVVHTSVVPQMPDGSRKTSDTFPSASPFAYAEDYMGTNLVASDARRFGDGVEAWSKHYERVFLMRLRQSRHTSLSHIGVLSAPETMVDEADQPNTRWSQDTHFRAVAFLSERHLKEKVSSPLQLEEVLVTKATPDQYLAFFRSCQQETSSRVPLPTPSVWVYEGEAQQAWVDRYHPAAKAAHAFFRNTLSADVKAASSPEAVTRAVAASLKNLHAVLLARIARQVSAGVCPDWARPDTTPEQKLAWTRNVCERTQRSVEEGDMDPEDLLDTSDDWAKEHKSIEEVMQAKVEGCSFTLKEFWMHTLRREELETEYLLRSDHLRDVAAAAQRALLDELNGDHAAVFAGVEDAVARGYLDLRAAVFAPRFNPIYAKLHYAKFGTSSVVQHTNAARRQLLYHHASSVEEVVAAADLYFATKPMSSRLNYASPYTFRKSFVGLCAAYGVDTAHAAQRPFLLSASHLAMARDAVARVVKLEAERFGEARRARQRAQRQSCQRLLTPVSNVMVCEPVSELLPTGAETAAITLSASSTDSAVTPVKAWVFGSVKRVRYHWPSPQLDKLKFFLQANNGGGGGGGGSSGMTAEKVLELEDIKRSGRLEVSLWRRRSAAEVEMEKAAAEKEAKEVAALVERTPELAEVKAYASNLFRRLSRSSGSPEADGGGDGDEHAEWQFAVMLDDSLSLDEEESVSLYMPYADANGEALPPGEYRVRVRAYAGGGSDAHPAMCTEAFSDPFTAFDALPQLFGQFFATPNASETAVDLKAFDGKELVAFCEFLRAAGVDVPLRFEFEAGQGLDVKGNIPVARFLSLLKGDAFHRSHSERGITSLQKSIEPDCRAHWQLYHPGATADEWACARRDVLDRAMAQERAWWLPDPVLSVGDVVTGPVSDTGVAPANYPATARYGTELCSILSASGSSHEDEAVPAAPGTVDRRLRADCTVDGTGAILSLSFAGTTTDVSLDSALEAALASVRRAQDRHSTLSMFKLAPFEAAAQVAVFCGVHRQEFGGKYARTYCYAIDKAKREIAETTVSGRVVLGADDDSDKARLSEMEKKVDRFASDTHPELRKKQFAVRQTLAGQTVEDPTPDQVSTWNR